MALDPNIALGVRGIEIANPIAQYAQVSQIQNAQQANQLHQLQIREAEATAQERNALRQLNPSAPDYESQLFKVNPQLGIAYRKEANTAAAQAATLKKTQTETTGLEFKQRIDKANKAISDIAALNSPEEAITSIDAHLTKGDIDQEKADMLKANLGSAPSFGAWQKSMLTNILDAKERLTLTAPKPTQVDLNNKKIFLDLNPNSPTFQKEIVPSQEVGMTPFQAGELKTRQGQLAVAQQRLAAETATGTLSPESLALASSIYLQTGTLPPLGIGKGAANVKAQIMNEAAKTAMGGESGANAVDAAKNIIQNKVELAGSTAGQRTLGTQIANVQIAANEAKKMIDIARPYVDRVDPVNYPKLNAVGNYVASNTGDPNIVGLTTALNGLVNTYARAINPKGVATVSDKNHAREIINTQMAKGQINEAFKVMGQEMDAALASGPETRATMRTQATGKPAHSPALSGLDQQALDWAKANPTDPRATQIKQRLGM